MAVTTFDTLKFAKRLKEAGVPIAEAEAISEAFKEVQGEMDIATRQDIGLLKQDIDLLKRDIQRDMKELEQRMTIKLGSLMVIAVGVVAAIVKLLN
jgi:DNA-binding transcriptional MerR regulator